MSNERLRAAMLRSGVPAAELAEAAGVDVKTVSRWLSGRAPHRRTRLVVAALLGEEEAALWPTARPDIAPGAPATGEIVSAYAHRSELPQSAWSVFLDAREKIDLLGYAYPFIFEMNAHLPAVIATRCEKGAKVRIVLADPTCSHVGERDDLEQLGGTLVGRIHNALNLLAPIANIPGVEIGLHTAHLYNATFRFDDQMIVTPYLYRTRGYQHPALHLRRLSPFGIFASYAEQFEQIWGTVHPMEGTWHGHPPRLLRRPERAGSEFSGAWWLCAGL